MPDSPNLIADITGDGRRVDVVGFLGIVRAIGADLIEILRTLRDSIAKSPPFARSDDDPNPRK